MSCCGGCWCVDCFSFCFGIKSLHWFFFFPDLSILLLSTRSHWAAARLQQNAQCYVLAEVLRCLALLQVFGISPTISSWHHFPPAFVSRAQAGLVHVKTGTGRQPSSSISPTTHARLSFLFRRDGLGSLHISVIVRVQIILKVIRHRPPLESGDFLYLNSKASPGHQKANNEHKQSGAKYIYNFCIDRFLPPVQNRSCSFSQIKVV